MENRAHALLAGLFTLIFLVAAALAVWWLSDSSEKTHTYLLETRGSVSGLNLEAQVRYRGIRAGKVKEIYTDPEDPAKLLVKIVLGRQYRLTDKTLARLDYQGVTGIAYVMLEEGGAQGRPLEPNEASPPRLPLQPGLLDRLGQRAGDITGQLAELVTRLNQVFDERNLGNLQRTLDNLAVSSESLKALPEVMARLKTALSPENLAHLNALLAQLDKSSAQAAPLAVEARQLVATLHGLAQRLDALAATAGALGERLDTTTLPGAEKLIHEAAAATRRLDRLIEMLNDTPQALLFGPPAPQPGPGEQGFTAPAGKE
ncbi:MlaD family protein [Sulfuricystis multivorans]|uniref:MlaD family protein n=1 Tax=Sulfuricystis multivorans TaxID=2211108 RepID=UPI000F825F75|nr:MlaD family protein [Sulfuricystis multivorans]